MSSFTLSKQNNKYIIWWRVSESTNALSVHLNRDYVIIHLHPMRSNKNKKKQKQTTNLSDSNLYSHYVHVWYELSVAIIFN